ncbi:conserved hypothetical protein [Hyphomicrobiales bacterium]|nr:conserved hypothetical protein [Hyphomicrobiales bacterium]CAH1692476.1 conserved hypothetical protein [Hyphomicrobiales bacterium]
MKNSKEDLGFDSPIYVNISVDPVLSVRQANILLNAKWPLIHILDTRGMEPEPLKRARNACAVASMSGSRQDIEYARKSFERAARSAGVLMDRAG